MATLWTPELSRKNGSLEISSKQGPFSKQMVAVFRNERMAGGVSVPLLGRSSHLRFAVQELYAQSHGATRTPYAIKMDFINWAGGHWMRVSCVQKLRRLQGHCLATGSLRLGWALHQPTQRGLALLLPRGAPLHMDKESAAPQVLQRAIS